MKLSNQDVYNYLLLIPYGKVVTYGQIAEYLGNKNFARTVGNILHDNPDGNKYPCYKVVNSKGCLSEHYAFGGVNGQMQRLLNEGINVENNRVELSKYLWNGLN
jgi:O-6-methylguanine DNA methyltransferase